MFNIFTTSKKIFFTVEMLKKKNYGGTSPVCKKIKIKANSNVLAALFRCSRVLQIR